MTAPFDLDTITRRAPWPAVLAAAGLSAVAFYFSTADHAVGVLAWVAPIPILVFAFALAAALRRREPVEPAAGGRVAAAAFAASFLGNLSWLVLYRGVLPPAGLAALALLLAIAFTADVLLTCFVAARLGRLAGVLVFPAAWVAFELAMARLSPHGTAGSVAYSQVDVVRLIQLAAWTGLAGITFLVYFVAAGLAAAFADRREGRIRWSLLAVPAVAFVAAFGAGAWRLQTVAPVGRALAGLASIDQFTRHFDTTVREEALPVVEAYAEAAGTLARRGAEVVVMPEKMVGVAPAYEEEVSRLFASIAESEHVLIVAGFNEVGRETPGNVAAVFSRGARALEYEKQRLVPGLEAEYKPGPGPGFYKAPGGMTGVAICKDMDFPEVGREYGRAGVGILFVPAWDFTRDGRLHSRMAVMRGVEGGYSIARAAANGLLTGSDYLGQVVTQRASDEAPQCMLLASLPLGPGKTFYAEHGDLFGWASAIAAGVLTAFASGLRALGSWLLPTP